MVESLFADTVSTLPLTLSPVVSAVSLEEPSLRFHVMLSAELVREIAVWLA